MYTVLLIYGFFASGNSNPSKMDELFYSLTGDNAYDITKNKPTDAIIKNISIDLEKLNLTMFTEKLKENTNDTKEVKPNKETRRLQWHGKWWEWNRATQHLIKNKIFDMMLQTIYMARHKIKQLENEAYYNPQDTSYRIAFLYRRLRRVWKKMRDIYTLMEIRRRQPNKRFDKIDPFLILHHKAAKLHVDFLYLWWVLVKLHEKYDYRHGIPNTTPH